MSASAVLLDALCSGDADLGLGAQITLQGLQNAQELNGQKGLLGSVRDAWRSPTQYRSVQLQGHPKAP